MDVVERRFSDILEVRELAHADFPFNLSISVRSQSKRSFKNLAMGAGVYLLTFGTEVVYVGKYKPITTGNILEDRWLRHFETMTLRGHRLGFGGPKNPQQRLEQILRLALHPNLRDAIERANDLDRFARFRDTGVCTSLNRIAFASENWEHFRTAGPHDILDKFAGHFLKISAMSSQQKSNIVVGQIEKALIARYTPCCNQQYKHERHSPTRRLSVLADVMDDACEQAKIFTNNEIRQRLTLSA